MLGKSTDERIGELQSVDGYMNIALEKCEEHVNGVKKRSYGDAFIRGNNGTTSLHPNYTPSHFVTWLEKRNVVKANEE